jgi:hypothetical protein
MGNDNVECRNDGKNMMIMRCDKRVILEGFFLKRVSPNINISHNSIQYIYQETLTVQPFCTVLSGIKRCLSPSPHANCKGHDSRTWILLHPLISRFRH